jgi:amino acid adenylation domain-containing protein
MVEAIINDVADEVYVFPTSFAQQRLWFLSELEPNSSAYNLPTAIRLSGKLNFDALEKSINEIVRRHESLRTTFSATEGKPMQVVKPAVPIKLAVTSLTHLPEQEREAQVRRLTKSEARAPFDLKRGPLLRTSLLELGPEEHVLLFTMHHIISDGWSRGVLVREAAALYDAFSAGLPSPLPELPVQYADYAVWQRDWLQGDALDAQLSYWREQLVGAAPMLELPLDRPRPSVQTFRGANRRSELSRALTDSLKEFARREGVTLFMMTLAVFQALLSRYTGQRDVVVGTPIAGRGRLEVEGLIGFFVNTLVLRTEVRGEESFRELLGRVREVVLGAYAHQDVPFEKLVEELQPERSLSHTPLFQVMLVMQNAPREVLEMAGLRVSGAGAEAGTAKFDLTLTLNENNQQLSAVIGYNTDLFKEAVIERMLGHFERLLQEAVQNPDEKVGLLQMLTEEEREQVLVEWNDTDRDYPTDKCLHELFTAQAALTPDAVALVHEETKLTYRELNERANQLAHHLRGLGVGPEVMVGILLERGVEMIVGILGTLKAGGAYVPLDPAYPQDRITFMLQDSRAPVLLTQQHLADHVNYDDAKLVFLDTDWGMIEQNSRDNPPATATEENLAYVIYTSGSTGRPKGVAIKHCSPVVLMYWALELYGRAELSSVLAATSICFDLSIFEIFVPLSCGGTVVLAPDVLHLPALATSEEVTLVNTVPSAMAELVREDGIPDSVRTINLAGEALNNSLAQQVYQQENVRRVYNLYGPSEDTTYSTGTLVAKGADTPPTIGRPIVQTRVYVLDEWMGPVPIGVSGELYIGGDGLARDYLRRPKLTAERFVPDPFSTEGGQRLYRTGDVARYRPDGEIEFLGRSDHQVKIRGFRIELGEIEAALMSHPAVRQAVVVARDVDGSGKQLVAYVVCDAEVEVSELRRHARERVPEYMVPGWVVVLEEMPLTPNGKVDRKRLPAPEKLHAEERRERIAPRTPTEEALHGIWSEVLGVEQMGVDENFFELGGHSLLATQVVSRVREAFGVEVPLRALFEAVTIERLAEAVEEQRRRGAALQVPAIGRVSRQQYRVATAGGAAAKDGATEDAAGEKAGGE